MNQLESPILPAGSHDEFGFVGCSSCTRLILYHKARTLHLICPQCQAPIQVIAGTSCLQGKPLFSGKQSPTISMGQQGILHGAMWTILGWIQSHDVSDSSSRLVEYQVYNEFWGMGWILNYRESWLLLRLSPRDKARTDYPIAKAEKNILQIDYAGGAFSHPIAPSLTNHAISEYEHNGHTYIWRHNGSTALNYEALEVNPQDIQSLTLISLSRHENRKNNLSFNQILLILFAIIIGLILFDPLIGFVIKFSFYVFIIISLFAHLISTSRNFSAPEEPENRISPFSVILLIFGIISLGAYGFLRFLIYTHH